MSQLLTMEMTLHSFAYVDTDRISAIHYFMAYSFPHKFNFHTFVKLHTFLHY